MATAVVVDIAEAVKEALNDATLSLPFTAERLYVVNYGNQDEDPDQFAELRVCVMARELSMAILSRGQDDFDYVVDVGIFKRVGTETTTDAEITAACDPLMGLVQEITDLLRSEAVISSLPARFLGLTNDPISDAGKLAENQLFASLVSLTFKKMRPR